jgi:hypothetical protein
LNYRISHCAGSLDKYYSTLREKIEGFTNRGPHPGDCIYLVVKKGKVSYCGARFILGEFSDRKPWPYPEKYVQSLNILNVEYCVPFDISILSEIGGKSWAIKYVLGSKIITDQKAIELLNSIFNANVVNDIEPISGDEQDPLFIQTRTMLHHIEGNDQVTNTTEKDSDVVGKGVQKNLQSEESTRETKPKTNQDNETTQVEKSVFTGEFDQSNIFSVLKNISPENSILLPFNTNKLTGENSKPNLEQRVSKISKKVLIQLDKSKKSGIPELSIIMQYIQDFKGKTSSPSLSFDHDILPETIHFLEILTNVDTFIQKERFIHDWIDLIMALLDEDEASISKFTDWLRVFQPEIKERSIDRQIQKALHKAFLHKPKITLITDSIENHKISILKAVSGSFNPKNTLEIIDLDIIKRNRISELDDEHIVVQHK